MAEVRQRTPQLDAWVSLLRAHSAATRRLSAELLAEHGLTINDFEVMLHLSRAPERRMRRVDLAESVLLTPSGITRLLEGLERAGFVERRDCEEDRRVSYAVLTDAGEGKLEAASATHFRGVDDLLGDAFSREELEALAELLGRVGSSAAECPAA